MANTKVTPINAGKKSKTPTPEQLEQEWIDSNHGVLNALDHMLRTQEISADYKARMETALAKAEKWWRWECNNRDRLYRHMVEGKPYEKKETWNDLPKGEADLEAFKAESAMVESKLQEPSPDLSGTEPTNESEGE